MNPAGYENCEKLHNFIRRVFRCIFPSSQIIFSQENISKTENVVGISVNDCRIFFDGSRIQERRYYSL